MLQVQNISKEFLVDGEKILAIHDVSFDVLDGEFFTIIGPSGCGKSTLLRILARLNTQTSGEILWREEPRLGFVFQNYALFPYLTVYENIEFGLKMREQDLKKSQNAIHELIDEVGLTGFEDKHPKELSGGMKQRVGIARALAIEPNVLLLDEPFSSLDEFTADTLRKLLLKLWKKYAMTVIHITHLVQEALELADRIAVMTPSPGSIETIIKNPLKRPRNLRVKEFFTLEDMLKQKVQG